MNQSSIIAIVFLSPLLTLVYGNANSDSSPSEKVQTGGRTSSTLKLGEAKGTLRAYGQTTELKFAYACKVAGWEDETKKEIEVLLTDDPIPKEDLIPNQLSCGSSALCLRVNDKGRIVFAKMFMIIGKPGAQRALGIHVPMSGEVVRVGATSIEGKSEKEIESDGVKWSYAVAFNARMVK
jgi:hypothetical protein